MSGDYSRRTFRPGNHYAAVLMQQGRVQLDADWNEQAEILDRRSRVEAIDVIGRCGVPRETPDGFRIGVEGGNLTIGRGRIYVDGHLAENHGLPPRGADEPLDGDGAQVFERSLAEMQASEPLPYDEQPYLPDPPALPGPGRHLVYLDVWQREVTALERPDLVEVAVGVDTTTRLQTVWQVRILPDVDASVTCDTPAEDIAAYLTATRPSAGRLTAGEGPAAEGDDPCDVPAGGGYRGLENQLYRVEIHTPGPPGVATFKWSRENRSIASGVLAIAPDRERLTVESLGRDQVLRFENGAWVEVLDDRLELAGESGHVARVIDADEASGIITIAPAIPASLGLDAASSARHTRVRRWDQRGVVRDDAENPLVDLDDPASGGVIPVPPSGTAVVLEDGVRVEFDTDPGDGAFRVGEHWVFAARHADASVEALRQAPPVGVHHHYCRLALLSVTGPPGAVQLQVDDCRPRFPSLTGICADDVCFDDDRCRLGAETVQEALEVLCAREAGPAGVGRCTLTLGADGVEDLQAAIERLPPEGGCICVPGREFRQSRTVVIGARQAIAIEGCGPASVIRFDGDAGQPLLAIRSSQRIVVRDLSLLNEAGPVIELLESVMVRVLDCLLTSRQSAAVRLTGGAENVAIEGCEMVAEVGVHLPEFAIAGLHVARTRFDVSRAAVEGGQGARLADVRFIDNVVDSTGLGVMLAMLPEQADLAVVRNRFTIREGPAVQVGTMRHASALTLSANRIGSLDMPALQGVLVVSLEPEAELLLDENSVVSQLEAVMVAPDGGEPVGSVRVNANTLRSLEGRVVVTIGGRAHAGAGTLHALFSNNQVYSQQEPTREDCTVNLSARRLVVMGNHVEDGGRARERGGVSICLSFEPEAATAIGNVTSSGVNLEGSVSTNVVVTNNATM